MRAAWSGRAHSRGRLNANLAIIDKRRRRASEVTEMQLVGEVRDSIALLVDDMVDTAGTITEAAKVVSAAGASEVMACATHPILSDPSLRAAQPFQDSRADHYQHYSAARQSSGRTQPFQACCRSAALIAEAMRRIHNEESVSSLFN